MLDQSGVAGVWVNGAPVTVNSVDTSFAVTVRLIAGSNRILVTARDRSAWANEKYDTLTVLCRAPAGGRLLHGSKLGGTSSGTGSATSPFSTIAGALAAFADGDTLQIDDSEDYNEQISISGRANVVIRGKPGQYPWIKYTNAVDPTPIRVVKCRKVLVTNLGVYGSHTSDMGQLVNSDSNNDVTYSYLTLTTDGTVALFGFIFGSFDTTLTVDHVTMDGKLRVAFK